MFKLNAKLRTMKLLILIISVIFISYQLTAQTNNKNHSSENNSQKIKASELKKKGFQPIQVTTKEKLLRKKKLEPVMRSKEEEVMSTPKQ